jgi:xylan 1,4-beta-xylosidase
VLASKDKRSAAILIWNYHDADKKGDTAQIIVGLKNIPSAKIKLTQYRIDDKHSNSYELWKEMGSPQQPGTAQIKELEQAGQLQQLEKAKELVQSGQLLLNIQLPRQGVSLLKLDW